ncbi:hypothetical protein ACFVVL_29735 [Kitasatospora sp. NPDC058115]|uniref:hypothetical protein n=1 Tax=Kitasatospora sp. NPDC058115 TaxID=3346347 RepID=UPI0036DDCC16
MSRANYEDPFNLSDGRVYPRLSVKFGQLEVGSAVIGAKFTNSINSIAEAEFTLDLRSALVERVDFSSTVTISQVSGLVERPVFMGSVMRAVPQGSGIEISCSAMPSFSERKMRPTATRGIPGVEMIYTLARGAGLRDDQIKVEGPHGVSSLPIEVFEIICPVSGMEIDSPFKSGRVTFHPIDNIAASIPAFESSPLRADFLSTQAFGVVYVTSNLLISAESEGIKEIELALSWITVRTRYSLPSLPGGSTPEWVRGNSLTAPKREALVSVRGVRTNRSWLRDPDFSIIPVTLTSAATQQAAAEPVLPDSTPQNIQQALLACSRAAQGVDSITRITAIWEAIEFYVGKTEVPNIFSKAEMRKIRRSIPKFGEQAKDNRIEQAVAGLNNPPLFVRLLHRLAVDGVPIGRDEIDLLSQLRRVRNLVVHGRAAVPPGDDEVAQGVAIVSRILVHSVARSSQRKDQ